MKIRPVAAELFHVTDGQTGRHDEANGCLVLSPLFVQLMHTN